MKDFHREDLWFSLCGLNCGLCPMRAGGYCPGCGGGEGNQSCRFARCALTRGVEYCFLCGEYPCEKYAGVDEYDSFITHQRREKDMQLAKAEGLDAYRAVQRKKAEVLRYLLEECNDGRKKTFYFLAVNLLDWEDLRAAVDRTALDRLPDRTARAAQAAGALKEAASRRGIGLTLRKKKRKEEK